MEVVLAEKNSGHERLVAIGAFVIPNSPIPQDTPLERFVVPKEFVEKNAGLRFFPTLRLPEEQMMETKTAALCSSTKCILPPKNFWVKGEDKPNNSPQQSNQHAPKDDQNGDPMWKWKMEEKYRKQMQEFLYSKSEEISFSASISAYERFLLHKIAQEKGLEHIIKEDNSGRVIILKKKTPNT